MPLIFHHAGTQNRRDNADLRDHPVGCAVRRPADLLSPNDLLISSFGPGGSDLRLRGTARRPPISPACGTSASPVSPRAPSPTTPPTPRSTGRNREDWITGLVGRVRQVAARRLSGKQGRGPTLARPPLQRAVRIRVPPVRRGTQVRAAGTGSAAPSPSARAASGARRMC